MTDFYCDEIDGDCPLCGGSGVIESECTCMDDTCCCLEPQPPDCPECAFRAKSALAVTADDSGA